ILACFAASFPAVLTRLSPASLEQRPIDICVLLLLPAAALSLLPLGNMGELASSSFLVFKLLVYYLLFVSLVTTPRRLRLFIACLIVFAVAVAVVSALDFHRVLPTPTGQLPRPLLPTGKLATVDPKRMYGPGIFQDPNDVCVLIVTALVLVVGRLADS